MKRTNIILLSAFLIMSLIVSAQATDTNKTQTGMVVKLIIDDNGDSIFVHTLKPYRVVALRPYNDKEKDKQFRRLRYHVVKVYPMARLAADKLEAYNEELEGVKSKSKRKKLMKIREKELKEEFEETIKNMSVTQGKILVKLIDRETGESTYDIIKEMRGGFKAFVWQGVAKLYGSSLKMEYDPENNEEDEMIERIVQMIEAGQI